MRTPQNYVKNADTTEAYFNKSHLLRRVRFNKKRTYSQHFLQQSWTLISRHFRNVAEKCFSENAPKVLIFGLVVRTGTINDFSYWDWVLQSWTLIFAQMRNVAKKCFSANVPKVLIFGLPVRTGTINDFSCKDWVLSLKSTRKIYRKIYRFVIYIYKSFV